MTAEEILNKWTPKFEGLTWAEISEQDWAEFLEDFRKCLNPEKLIDGWWSTEV